MSGNVYAINSAFNNQSVHGSSIVSRSARADVRTLQRDSVAGATFGAAVETSAKYTNSVRSIAAHYDNFSEALLPMVLASGVTGDAAKSVTQAILANPGLRAQAERAYDQARQG